MKIVSLNQLSKTVLSMAGAQGVFKQIPISKVDGTPNTSIRVFSIEPGGHTPLHNHPFEHLNYIIQGNGVLVSEGGEREINEGDFALVLPGETHQYKNKGERQMVMICAVPKNYE